MNILGKGVGLSMIPEFILLIFRPENYWGCTEVNLGGLGGNRVGKGIFLGGHGFGQWQWDQGFIFPLWITGKRTKIFGLQGPRRE